MTNSYDLVVVFDTTLGDSKDGVDGALKKLLGNAKLTSTEVWGKRPLAYQINKQSEAVFVKTVFEVEPFETKSIDDNLKLSEDVLRYLLIRSPKKKAEKAVVEKKSGKEKKAGN